MSSERCPCCGAKCTENTMYPECDTSQSLIPLPQPDLTGIREVYERYKHLDGALSDLQLVSDVRSHILYRFWPLIREICKARRKRNVKAHNGDDNR